jgi:hypothetical protein
VQLVNDWELHSDNMQPPLSVVPVTMGMILSPGSPCPIRANGDVVS